MVEMIQYNYLGCISLHCFSLQPEYTQSQYYSAVADTATTTKIR